MDDQIEKYSRTEQNLHQESAGDNKMSIRHKLSRRMKVTPGLDVPKSAKPKKKTRRVKVRK